MESETEGGGRSSGPEEYGDAGSLDGNISDIGYAYTIWFQLPSCDSLVSNGALSHAGQNGGRKNSLKSIAPTKSSVLLEGGAR
jgi:hypothetical protein